MLIRVFDRFFRHEAAGGILLMLSAVAALAIYNSPLADAYDAFLDAKLEISLNGKGLAKPLLLWINDGLMAIFFFLVGLELKREVLEGKLRNPRDVILPGLAAVGGMIVPAAIYAWLNWNDPVAINGWAIPAATDIAFALGVLALLGARAHPALKIFLLTLAILDDIGAILIIALFYTDKMDATMLLWALAPLAGLAWLNFRGGHRIAPYILLGAVLWFLVLKSGVHATIAGVVLAFFIPLKDRWGKSPLHALENGLGPWVFFGIVPLFAFANAGLPLTGLSLSDLLAPVPLGVAAGLFLGKQIGVFGVTWGAVKLGLAKLPHGLGWAQIHGVSCLAGIGFTMSLFIGGLSFKDPALGDGVRLGVLTGSFLSAVVGYLVLRLVSAAPKRDAERERPSPAA